MSLSVFRSFRWSMQRHVLRGSCVVLGLLAPAIAQAQTPAAPAPSPVAGWQNGFFVQSADGQHRLQFGLTAQLDGRFAAGDEADVLTDTFALRRLRPIVRGRLGGHFEFQVGVDFGSGTATLQDAYVDTRFSEAVRLRLGKTKSPLGHERLHAVPTMLFFERALPSGVAPNRDVGVQVLGNVMDGRVSYNIGLFNGSRDGSSSDLDTSDGKDLVARVVARPASGLSVALSGSTGEHTGAAALPSYRTTIFQQTFFSYSGAAADGRLTRYSPYVSYYDGPFGGFAEYVTSRVPVRGGDVVESIWHEAWQVTGSWVLTGEDATEAGVAPQRDFDFEGGGWGALQVAVRYHTLKVDDDAFDLGFATPGSNRTATAWSAGLNWYLNRYVSARAHFERTVFDSNDGSRPAENVFALRTQLSF